MKYEPQYERFAARGPAGEQYQVEFSRAGWLSAGDRPELYFFRVDGDDVVVGISGRALQLWQTGRRFLSREEKIDVAGLYLKKQLEAGRPLRAETLYIQANELSGLLQELSITL
ncbi:MAG: hypothetical protein K6U02_04900 [Firmicutes bacterium]|nr:hypothetical protein [Bacillota bacterium]